MSLKKVLVCSRPKSGHGVDHSPNTGGKGANPTPQDSLAVTREFYGLQPTKGGKRKSSLPPERGAPTPEEAFNIIQNLPCLNECIDCHFLAQALNGDYKECYRRAEAVIFTGEDRTECQLNLFPEE